MFFFQSIRNHILFSELVKNVWRFGSNPESLRWRMLGEMPWGKLRGELVGHHPKQPWRSSVAHRSFVATPSRKDAQGEARFWTKDERQVSLQQPGRARNGEVHYEVFGWWHVLQEVEHATYPMEPTSCNEVRWLPEALCCGSDIGHFFTKTWSRWCLEMELRSYSGVSISTS